MLANLLSDSKKLLKRSFLVLLATVITACSGNIYQSFANKDTDDALYEAALEEIDSGTAAAYTDAINKINSTSATFRAQPAVVQSLAGAYAGRCGQNFLSMVTAASQASSDMFYFIMKLFTSTTVTPADCYTAQTTLETLGSTAVSRTPDQNFFMFFLGISKIGTYLQSTVDKTPAPDGVIDGGIDPCNHLSISDTTMKQIITGFGLALDNFTAVSAAIAGGSALNGLTAIQTACTGAGVTCTFTDPNNAAINPLVIAYFRQLLVSTDLGFGTHACTSGQALPQTAATPCCPAGIL